MRERAGSEEDLSAHLPDHPSSLVSDLYDNVSSPEASPPRTDTPTPRPATPVFYSSPARRRVQAVATPYSSVTQQTTAGLQHSMPAVLAAVPVDPQMQSMSSLPSNPPLTARRLNLAFEAAAAAAERKSATQLLATVSNSPIKQENAPIQSPQLFAAAMPPLAQHGSQAAVVHTNGLNQQSATYQAWEGGWQHTPAHYAYATYIIYPPRPPVQHVPACPPQLRLHQSAFPTAPAGIPYQQFVRHPPLWPPPPICMQPPPPIGPAPRPAGEWPATMPAYASSAGQELGVRSTTPLSKGTVQAGVGHKRLSPWDDVKRAGQEPKRVRADSHGSGPLLECVQANKRITAAKSVQDVLDIVASSAAEFDAVCMATSLHRMACLASRPQHVTMLQQHEAFARLLTMIGASLEHFSARNIANTLWALAKLGHRSWDLVQSLAQEALRKLDGFNAQNLANTLWAFATLGSDPGSELLEALAGAALKRLDEFTPQNLSNTVLAYAKLAHKPQALLDAVAGLTANKIASFNPQALSNTVWAFAKLEMRDDGFLRNIANQALATLKNFNAQNLANTVWAFANLGMDCGALIDAVAEASLRRLREFLPQNLSNTLWSFAKLGKPAAPLKPLLEAAVEHAVATVGQFQPQSTANLLWAFANLDHTPPNAFFDAFEASALRNLADFAPQNIANYVWALANLKHCSQPMLAVIAHEVARRVNAGGNHGFSRQHLANVLWAVATLEGKAAGCDLAAAVASDLREHMTECNPQEISNSIWALAKLGYYNEALMDGFAKEAAARMPEFSEQNMANLAWAYGKTSHDNPPLMAATSQRGVQLVKAFSLQHLSNIMLSWATLRHKDSTAVAAFIAEIRSRASHERFNSQQLSNLLWSLCLLQACTPDLWQLLLGKFETLGVPIAELPEEGLSQVYQAFLLMLVDHPGVPVRESRVVRAGQEVWMGTARNVTMSHLHRDVAASLAALGVPHTIEHMTEDSCFSMDIVLTGEKIAIEVDGPHHFTANTLRPLGELLARTRLLEARGWAVLSVPFFEWAKHNAEGRTALLLRGIQQARQRLQQLPLQQLSRAGAAAEDAHLPFDERPPGT